MRRSLLGIIPMLGLLGALPGEQTPAPERNGCRHGQYGRKKLQVGTGPKYLDTNAASALYTIDTCLSCGAERVDGGKWMGGRK